MSDPERYALAQRAGLSPDAPMFAIADKLEDDGQDPSLARALDLFPISLQVFVDQYIDTALLSSLDESDDPEQYGFPLDRNYGTDDIAPCARLRMREDCARFLLECREMIGDETSLAGHCFWLSRNGRGANFRDRTDEFPDCTDALMEASKRFGECDLYVGDDGLIYVG